MNFILIVCFLILVLFEGCHKPPSSMNEDGFKNNVNTNSSVDFKPTTNANLSADPGPLVNSSTSVAQPDTAKPVTLVNVAF